MKEIEDHSPYYCYRYKILANTTKNLQKSTFI